MARCTADGHALLRGMQRQLQHVASATGQSLRLLLMHTDPMSAATDAALMRFTCSDG